MARTGFQVVFVTTSSSDEASRIAGKLVEEKLAACVNILAGCRSVYRWKGKVENAEECLLVIKTSRARFPALAARVAELHSYEVPEIVALPIEAMGTGYAHYLTETLASDG